MPLSHNKDKTLHLFTKWIKMTKKKKDKEKDLEITITTS